MERQRQKAAFRESERALLATVQTESQRRASRSYGEDKEAIRSALEKE